MIFKFSSASKLFFTYICPRFYGGGGMIPGFPGPSRNPGGPASVSDRAGRMRQALSEGRALSPEDTTFLQNYTDAQANSWSGTIDPRTGVEAPNARGADQSSADYTNYLKDIGSQGATISPELLEQYNATPDAAPSNSPYNLTDTLGKTAYFDPTTGNSTLPDFLQVQDTARNLTLPDQYAQGTGAYNQALEATQGLTNYNPSNVSAQQSAVASANATGYNASNTAAPTDIAAQRAQVAQMQGADNVSANQLQQYQMQGPSAIYAPTAGTAQMAGPSSWLDQGTAAAYMNPYTQNVVDIQKREANRDYQQQLNQLNANSVKAGAFGGSRQAIEQAEAGRNQATRLSDIEAKGLQEAYTQGVSQFNTSQGQGLQAGQANLGASQQSTLANQAAQIQAMMANQGMDYNTALQNLQAKLGVQNTQSSSDLQAALANQGVQQQTQMTNMAANNVANNAYVQQQLQAAQSNQGAALTTAQANQVAQNAAAQYGATNQQNVNLANQGAQNQSNNAYAQQQLAAAQANQGAGLQANQQNLGAATQLGTIGQGLGALGASQNAATLSNLGALGNSAQAQQNLGQQYVDTQATNASNWLNAPNTINAQAVNALNAQPVSGGTTSTSGTAAAQTWARGGLIRKGSKK